ncbi:MAG: enhanced serine sensitivity protein SseB C-terminal domain-containing protein [Vampirovibrionales bacterium]|nr:enhanced serine sensitivity protein SseB C-terminal domain-containing protein [Vampirovibrionales bacterium]
MFWNLFGSRKSQKPSARASEEGLVKRRRPSTSVAELEALMERLADEMALCDETEFSSLMAPFYEMLGHATILVPTVESPERDGGGEKPASYRLMTVQNPEGETGVAVFTSPETLSMWIHEPMRYVGIPFRTLSAKVMEQGLDFVLINPAGPARAALSPYELSYLADGLAPPRRHALEAGMNVAPQTEITVWAPTTLSAQMLTERLKGCFGQRERWVKSAYVFDVSIAQGPSHLAMAIRLTEGEEERWQQQLLGDALAISREVLERNQYMDFFLLNESDDLERMLQSVTEPFFENRQAIG